MVLEPNLEEAGGQTAQKMRTIRGRRQICGIGILGGPANAQRTVRQFHHIRHNTGQVSSRLIVFLCGAGLLRRERGKDGCQLARAEQGGIAFQRGIGRPTRKVVGALVQQSLHTHSSEQSCLLPRFYSAKNCGKMICLAGLYQPISGVFRNILFYGYFFWRARVCQPLLRLCRPFMIFEGCLDSNPKCCRSKLARYRLSHPSLPKYWQPPAFGAWRGHSRWVERGWGVNF